MFTPILLLVLSSGLARAVFSAPVVPGCGQTLSHLADLATRGQGSPRFTVNQALSDWAKAPAEPEIRLSRIVSGTATFTPEEREAAESDFSSERDKVDRWFQMKGRVESNYVIPRSDRLVRAASAHLEVRGIAHEIVYENGHLFLIILPGNQSLYNRYAAGVKKLLPGTLTLYDPSQAIPLEFAASFTAKNGSKPPTINVSDESLGKGTPKDGDVVHETQHAQDEAKRIQGKTSPYQVRLGAKDSADSESFRLPGKGESYSKYIKMDELKRYRHDLRSDLEDLITAYHQGNREELMKRVTALVSTIEENKVIADRGVNTAAIVGALAKEMEKNSIWNRFNVLFGSTDTVNFEQDGKSFEARVLSQLRKDGTKEIVAVVDELSKEKQRISFTMFVPIDAAETDTRASRQKTLSNVAQIIGQASKENASIAENGRTALLRLFELPIEEREAALIELRDLFRYRPMPGDRGYAPPR